MKIIQGTDQACRMRGESVDLPEALTTDPPEWLTNEDALNEWRRLTPLLENAGVLKDGDLSMLAAACQMWGEFVDRTRRRVEVPASFMSQIRTYYSEFGLTPSSRAQAGGGKTEKKNPFTRNGRR
jgi:phage terminase small subunit